MNKPIQNHIGIVAIDCDGGIAKNKSIPWYISEDMQFFKYITRNSRCVMGYNTYKEIANIRRYPEVNDCLLPTRQCIVLSRHHDVKCGFNLFQVKKLSDLLPVHAIDTFYIGGLSIYNMAIDNLANKFYITKIKKSYDCDMIFDMDRLNKKFTLNKIIFENEILSIEEYFCK